jgi:hypothetical protein
LVYKAHFSLPAPEGRRGRESTPVSSDLEVTSFLFSRSNADGRYGN